MTHDELVSVASGYSRRSWRIFHIGKLIFAKQYEL